MEEHLGSPVEDEDLSRNILQCFRPTRPDRIVVSGHRRCACAMVNARSQRDRNKTSKIVIDATRQLPGEGGPATFPRTNREILTTLAPDALARVDAKWGELIAKAG